MATQSPFSFLDEAVRKLSSSFQPPAWAVQEMQRRMVLLLNHVLMQEPQAMTRLARQKGRGVLFRWQEWSFKVQLTPAGLLDLAVAETPMDLTLTVTEASPLALAQTLMAGEKPSVRIEGDVQLAADVAWLVDHVRWDVEEDLARLMGDAPAHALASAARRTADALQAWLKKSKPEASA
jgi:ubiquinone biosynthesis protein UbiJ